MTGERSPRGGRRVLVKRERSEACGELSAQSRCAAGCFIFCHGAFSLALRLLVIYRHPAASSLRRPGKLMVVEIYGNI